MRASRLTEWACKVNVAAISEQGSIGQRERNLGGRALREVCALANSEIFAQERHLAEVSNVRSGFVGTALLGRSASGLARVADIREAECH
jgi:hypothetical protein